MRTFQPHQIIVEYAGEIITQSECERRMKQIYKKDKVRSTKRIATPTNPKPVLLSYEL